MKTEIYTCLRKTGNECSDFNFCSNPEPGPGARWGGRGAWIKVRVSPCHKLSAILWETEKRKRAAWKSGHLFKKMTEHLQSLPCSPFCDPTLPGTSPGPPATASPTRPVSCCWGLGLDFFSLHSLSWTDSSAPVAPVTTSLPLTLSHQFTAPAKPFPLNPDIHIQHGFLGVLRVPRTQPV